MAGTIEINGTGGIIEGNLGAANVNVNLDDVLNFDGVDDKIDTNITFSTTFDGACTISAWLKPTDGQGTAQRFFGTRNSASEDWVQGQIESSGKVSLYYESNNNSTEAMTNTAVFPDGVTSWTHVAFTIPTSGTIGIYVNGVAQTLDGTKDGDMTGITVGDFSSTVDLFIGCRSTNGTPEGFFNGYIADVRFQDSVLTAAEIGVLASKINVDYTLVNSTQPTGWYKLTNNNTSNSGSGGGTPTVTGTTRHYDEFSVDVYDNSTTTDGTFTVTQGKVEGLSLTSVDMDGSADYITVADDASLDQSGDFTISTWVRPDTFDSNDRIIARGITGNGDFMISGGSSQRVRVYCKDVNGNAKDTASTFSALTLNVWNHITVVFDRANNKILFSLNGATFEEFTGGDTWDSALSTSSNALLIGFNGSSNYYDGEIRDVRIYDYALSQDQASSLYSNTYPQTPLHHWKIDEDTGATGNIENHGTATGTDGTGVSLATYTNGTLDLDGTLTIAANGTLSAPRGTLEMEGASSAFTFRNLATNGFIHNNGTVDVDGSTTSNPLIIDDDSVATTTFYNLTITNDHQIRTQNSITVENNYTLGSSTYGHIFDADTLGSKLTFTMGTSTEGGIMTLSDGKLRGANDSQVLAVVGACDTDYTQVNTNPFDFDFDDNGTWELKNLNFNTAITTDGNGLTLRLTGDCEFDAVTVSSGDTLDLNGQRAEFGGLLNVDGAMDYDGLVFLHDGIDHDGTGSNETSGKLIFATNTTNCDTSSENFDLIMINHPSFATSFTGSRMATNMLIGCGEYRLAGGTSNVTNLTVATGGELDDRSSGGTVNVAGDFTTSGGLIGTSALTFDGDNDIAHIPDDAAISGLTNMSVEAWAKYPSSGVSTFSYIIRKNAEYQLGINNNGYFYGIFHDGTAERDFVGNVDYRDGKWHHFAGTWDSTSGTGKFYVDGKLIGTSSGNAVAINNHGGVVSIGGRDADGTCSSFFEGSMDEIRIWNDVRTESEIRAGMFGTYSSSEAGLVGRWACDEGTGTTVADSSSNSNTLTFGAATGGTGGAGANPPSWAGAGTFTHGTSTLVMAKSGTQTICIPHNTDVNNLTINDGSTTELLTLGTTNGLIDIQGNLVVNEKIKSHADTPYSVIRMRTGDKTITIGSDVKTTALAEIDQLRFDLSGTNTMNLPESTTKKIDIVNGTVVATGDLTVTSELEIESGTTFNANGNTIAVKNTDVNGGTLDLRNSTLNFYTGASDTWTMSSSSTLTTGNTTVTGDSTRTPTNIPESAGGGFEIVGDVSNLDVTGDLTVIGSVTNCTGNIRQWHHTLDTQQLLDADSAGDDDLRLEKPTLDNANELQTG